MSLCDMCGKEIPSVLAEVEGTNLNVCDKCARFGKIIKKLNIIPANAKRGTPKKKESQIEEKEIVETIQEGFGKAIKEAREKLGLNQEDFAKKINEKVSVIHSLESEHHEPSIELARKLEKQFHIKIVEEREVEKISVGKKSPNQMTIGDLIKIK